MKTNSIWKRATVRTLNFVLVAVMLLTFVGGAFARGTVLVANAAEVTDSRDIDDMRAGDIIYKGARLTHPLGITNYNTYTVRLVGGASNVTLGTVTRNILGSSPWTADDDYAVVSYTGGNTRRLDVKRLLTADNTALEVAEFDYDFKEKTPVVKRGDVTLTADTDYTVTEESITTEEFAGEYSMTIQGTGIYSGEVTLEWKINIIEAAETATIPTEGVKEITFTGADGEEYTFTEAQINTISQQPYLVVKAGTTVTVTMAHQTAFWYFDGTQGGTELTTKETDNKDATYTYEFAMPGYDLGDFYKTYSIDCTEGAETAISDITEVDVKITDEEAETVTEIGYYPYTEITIVSSAKLVISVDAVEEISTEEYVARTYTYTFLMPAEDVKVALYGHVHNYEYHVEDDKLIRQCTNTDGECWDEENEEIEVVGLYFNEDEDVEFAYDGEAKVAEAIVAEGEDYEATEVEYYSVEDNEADGIETLLEGAPENAGSYVAKTTVTVGEDKYVLELSFEITPVTFKVIYNEADNADAYTTDDAIHFANYTVIGINDEVLAEITDYNIIGTDATRFPGNYTFTVVGVGNYTGEIEVEWALVSNDITANGMNIVVTTEYENGYAYAVVKITDAAGDEVTDFELGGVTRSNKAGTYTVEIQGVGDYTGTADAEWTVTNEGLANLVLTEAAFNEEKELVTVSVKRDAAAYVTEFGVYVSRDGEIPATATPEEALAALKNGDYSVNGKAKTPDTTKTYKVNITNGTATYMWVVGYVVVDGEKIYTEAQFINIAAVIAGADISESYLDEENGYAVYIVTRNKFEGVEAMGLIVARNNEIDADADKEDAADILINGKADTLITASCKNPTATTKYKLNVTNANETGYVWAIGFITLNGVTTYSEAYRVDYNVD